MDNRMFCFQCEQTAGCAGCTGKAGVCGKTAEVAELQDQLTGALVSPWPHAAGVRFAQCAELPRREFRHCSHHHPGGGFEAASQITVPQAVV